MKLVHFDVEALEPDLVSFSIHFLISGKQTVSAFLARLFETTFWLQKVDGFILFLHGFVFSLRFRCCWLGNVTSQRERAVRRSIRSGMALAASVE